MRGLLALLIGCSAAAPVARQPPPPPPAPPPPADAAIVFTFDAAPDAPAGPAMSPGDAFALAAKSEVVFYWKQPNGSCEAWKVDGEKLGMIERVDPKPAMHLTFALDGNTLAVAGVAGKHVLGEPPEAMCKDSFKLGKDDSSSFAVGDGTWYFSADACAAGGKAPASCAMQMSLVWREKEPAPKPFKPSGDVFVFDIHQGKPTCDLWQFHGKRLEQHTTDGMTYYGVTFGKDVLSLTGPNDVAKDGTTTALGDLLTLPVAGVGPDAYSVGGAAWFTDETACERVRRALIR